MEAAWNIRFSKVGIKYQETWVFVYRMIVSITFETSSIVNMGIFTILEVHIRGEH